MATHGTKAKLGESGYLIARSTELDLAEGSHEPLIKATCLSLSNGYLFVPQ